MRVVARRAVVLVDRRHRVVRVVPGVLLMHSGGKPPGRAWDDFEGALHMKSCQAITPENDRSTHYFFMQAHGFALDDESVTDAIAKSLVQAFEEDRETIRAQQAMLDHGPTRFVPIRADAAVNQFRKLLMAMCEEEAADRSAAVMPVAAHGSAPTRLTRLPTS